MTNNGESSASKRLKSPIPMDITDNIKGLFLPYLALGFTVQQTDFKKPNKSGYQALRCGFYAALEGLSLSHSKETLWDTDENWQNMLQSEEYKKTVRTSESLLEDDEEDELVLQRWCDDSWSLDSEQLSYLLMVANQHHGTNFQLGMITEGFRGRIDPETKEYDDEYLLPTAIRVVHHGTTNAPVVVSLSYFPVTVISMADVVYSGYLTTTRPKEIPLTVKGKVTPTLRQTTDSRH